MSVASVLVLRIVVQASSADFSSGQALLAPSDEWFRCAGQSGLRCTTQLNLGEDTEKSRCYAGIAFLNEQKVACGGKKGSDAGIGFQSTIFRGIPVSLYSVAL